MKLLVISQFFPYPPNNGGRMRIYQLVKGLSKRHDIHLIAFSQSRSDMDYVAELKEMCEQVHVVHEDSPDTPSLRRTISLLNFAPRSYAIGWSGEARRLVDELVRKHDYHAGLAFGLRNAEYLRSYTRMARILDNENCDTAFLGRLISEEPSNLLRFRRRLTWAKSRLYEARLATQFSAVLVVSCEDEKALSRIAPALANRRAIHVIPNGTDLALLDYRGPEVDKNRIISPGALTYSANYDAAKYFCREILPLVTRMIPEAYLVITGSTDGVDLSPFEGRVDVRLAGYVSDIRPEIARSAVVVVPTRIGGGTRLKILEAMALGAPVVATSFGAMGLDARHGHNILIGDTPSDFAAHVLGLMRDSEQRSGIVARGRDFVARNFGWDSIVSALNRVIESAVGVNENARSDNSIRIWGGSARR